MPVYKYTPEVQQLLHAKTKPEPYLHVVYTFDVDQKVPAYFAIYVWDTRKVVEEGFIAAKHGVYDAMPADASHVKDNGEPLVGASNIRGLAAFDYKFYCILAKDKPIVDGNVKVLFAGSYNDARQYKHMQVDKADKQRSTIMFAAVFASKLPKSYAAYNKHQVANENYIVQDGDLKTYVTTSVAYKAQFANVDCLHEPWLHLRRCQKLTMKGKDIVENIIGYVVYVWDTREIVQWIENKGKDMLALNTPKAVDNAQPLKDTKHLVPAWAMQDMKSSKDLWSMANMPEDVQKRYYNR